jgi:hypothetical protein
MTKLQRCLTVENVATAQEAADIVHEARKNTAELANAI